MALTKEEKKAKKEAKKLEKLRLEMEKKKQMRRDELKREIRAQAIRREDIEKYWRQMMFKIKEPVFKQDMEVMWHTFERTFDKKDHLISNIMKLIDAADDQFQRTIASFCETIDTMINKFLQDLDIMSVANENRTSELLKWGYGIKDRLESDHKAAEFHLQLLLFHGHTTADMEAWNTRGDNMVKIDEDRSKYLDIRENLTSFLENNYNAKWDEYKAVLKTYVIGTAENQKHCRRLRRKENMMADIIASQGKKIAMSDGILKRLRSELISYESGSKQAVFRDRRDRHRAACSRLKNNFLSGCAVDDKRLYVLVNFSDDAIDWLMAAHKKGEKIMRLASLCRKYETRREKVLPFGTDTPAETTQTKTTTRRQTVVEDPLVTLANNACAGLNRLWQRMAKAELIKTALLREKNILERENAAIMDKLEIYQSNGVSGAPATPITLKCTCNEKSFFRPVCIDGTIELKKYAKQW